MTLTREQIEDFLLEWNLTGENPTLAEICRLAIASLTPQPPQNNYQKRVQNWMMECFSMEICRDTVERNHRFLEESLELVQSLGCTVSEAHQLVDYVFNRPVGETKQEVGGVMVTLAALCSAADVDMGVCGEIELNRIWGKIEQIRAKQAAKPSHSPLPQPPAQQDDGIDWQTVVDAVSNAINNADGQISAAHLEDCFMKAGIGIFYLHDTPPSVAQPAKTTASAQEPEIIKAIAEAKDLMLAYDEAELEEGPIGLLWQLVDYIENRTSVAQPQSVDTLELMNAFGRWAMQQTPEKIRSIMSPIPQSDDEKLVLDALMQAFTLAEPIPNMNVRDQYHLGIEAFNRLMASAQGDWTLPKLPEGHHYDYLSISCEEDADKDIQVWIGDDHDSTGPTPRAAVLAAIEQIKPPSSQEKA